MLNQTRSVTHRADAFLLISQGFSRVGCEFNGNYLLSFSLLYHYSFLDELARPTGYFLREKKNKQTNERKKTLNCSIIVLAYNIMAT